MTIWITSGDRPSQGRVALQQAAGFRRFNREKSKSGDILINWGVAELANYQSGVNHGIKVINTKQAVSLATNKFKAFQQFSIKNIASVDWTESAYIVKAWLETSDVVVRNKLTGHSGDGIVILEKGTKDIPDAPLYTKYIPKTHEYRIHVVGKFVIDVQRKIRDPDREPLTWKVRSHANGFIFVRDGITVSDEVKKLAIDAVVACGLDFGAVDIILDKHNVPFVLEINTAPGLEGKTIESYATALKALCNGS